MYTTKVLNSNLYSHSAAAQ